MVSNEDLHRPADRLAVRAFSLVAGAHRPVDDPQERVHGGGVVGIPFGECDEPGDEVVEVGSQTHPDFAHLLGRRHGDGGPLVGLHGVVVALDQGPILFGRGGLRVCRLGFRSRLGRLPTPGPVAEGCEEAQPDAAPPVRSPGALLAVMAIPWILIASMVLMIPSARRAADAGTTPAVTSPAANARAARAVAAAVAAEMAAPAGSRANAEAMSVVAEASPRRVSRARSRPWAWFNRRRSVRSEQPSDRAACSCVHPCRPQSTTAARQASGSRSSSSRTISISSTRPGSVPGPGSARAAPASSRCRRADWARSFREVR